MAYPTKVPNFDEAIVRRCHERPGILQELQILHSVFVRGERQELLLFLDVMNLDFLLVPSDKDDILLQNNSEVCEIPS